MTGKPEPKDAKKDVKEPRVVSHPGMMGDGTEEQNLGERGDPSKRIKEDEADLPSISRQRRNPNFPIEGIGAVEHCHSRS